MLNELYRMLTWMNAAYIVCTVSMPCVILLLSSNRSLLLLYNQLQDKAYGTHPNQGDCVYAKCREQRYVKGHHTPGNFQASLPTMVVGNLLPERSTIYQL